MDKQRSAEKTGLFVVLPWLGTVCFGLLSAFLLLVLLLDLSAPYELGMSEEQVRSRIPGHFAETAYGDGRVLLVDDRGYSPDLELPDELESMKDLPGPYACFQLLLCKHGHLVAIAFPGENDRVQTPRGSFPGDELRYVPEQTLRELVDS